MIFEVPNNSLAWALAGQIDASHKQEVLPNGLSQLAVNSANDTFDHPPLILTRFVRLLIVLGLACNFPSAVGFYVGTQ